MSETFTIPSVNFKTVNEDGEILIQGNLLDIYYLCIDILKQLNSDSQKTRKVIYTELADALNEEYDSKLTWGEAIHVMLYIREEIAELKKNTLDIQKSQNSTE